MDLCMECKGCKGECPSNVDMAKLKYEFLDRYHKANGLPIRNSSSATSPPSACWAHSWRPYPTSSCAPRPSRTSWSGSPTSTGAGSCPPSQARPSGSGSKPGAGLYARPAARGRCCSSWTPSPTTTTRRSVGRPPRSWRDSGTRSSCLIRSAAGGPCSPPA